MSIVFSTTGYGKRKRGKKTISANKAWCSYCFQCPDSQSTENIPSWNLNLQNYGHVAFTGDLKIYYYFVSRAYRALPIQVDRHQNKSIWSSWNRGFFLFPQITSVPQVEQVESDIPEESKILIFGSSMSLNATSSLKSLRSCFGISRTIGEKQLPENINPVAYITLLFSTIVSRCSTLFPFLCFLFPRFSLHSEPDITCVFLVFKVASCFLSFGCITNKFMIVSS